MVGRKANKIWKDYISVADCKYVPCFWENHLCSGPCKPIPIYGFLANDFII